MNIVNHVEKFLGKISQGWKDKSALDGLQIVSFQDSPFEAVDTYMTIGLSHHELRISDVKNVRQELIFSVSRTGLSDLIASCLLYICELILKNHNAVLRGQVIRLPREFAEKLGIEAVYCAIPVFLDDAFATFNGSKPPTVIVWIMPIYESEANFVDANGWNKFEDLLVEKAPDLFSLVRESVI